MPNERRYGDLANLFQSWLPYDSLGPMDRTLFVWAMTGPRQAVQRAVADLKGFLRQADRDLAVLFNELGDQQWGFKDDATVREWCKLAIRQFRAALAVRDKPRGTRSDGTEFLRRVVAERRRASHYPRG